MSSYWIRKWIDEVELKSIDEIDAQLESKESLSILIGYAYEESDERSPQPPLGGRVLVGGVGLDLSGRNECMEHDCATKAVDRIARHTWHTFDKVVVNGLDSSGIADRIHEGKGSLQLTTRDVSKLRGHIVAALHVKNSGADDLIEFRHYPRAFCDNHYQEALRLSGFQGDVESAKETIAEHYLTGYSVEHSGGSDSKVFIYRHPSLETAIVWRGTDETSTEEIAWNCAFELAASFTGTILTSSVLARNLSAGIGQIAHRPSEIVERMKQRHVADQVAINVPIPMVENLTLGELMEVRRDEATEFQAFQAAVRKAIEERIKALPDDDAAQIGESVYSDVLEPELIRMERKLQRATEIFSRRAIATAAVSSTLTTIGLFELAPVVAPGIVLGAGGLLAIYNELLKDRKEVNTSDLHFLWSLSNKAS